MSKLSKMRNTLAAGTLAAAAVVSSGCDSAPCSVTSKVEGSPELTSAAEVLAYCEDNRHKLLSCLEIVIGEEKDHCSIREFSCSYNSLDEKINTFFSENGESCVESPATLHF